MEKYPRNTKEEEVTPKINSQIADLMKRKISLDLKKRRLQCCKLSDNLSVLTPEEQVKELISFIDELEKYYIDFVNLAILTAKDPKKCADALNNNCYEQLQ
jgi:hypothetical protein